MIHLDHAPQFIGKSTAPGTSLDSTAVQFKGLQKASSGDRLCVYQPSSHRHIATEVSKADFTKLMKVDSGKVILGSSHNAEISAAKTILKEAGVPEVDGLPTRLTLELAKRVGSGKLTPDVAALVARTPDTGERERILSLAGACPNVAELFTKSDRGTITEGQMRCLIELAAIHPTRADELASACLEHLADKSNALPNLDGEIIKGGIEASNDFASKQTTSGLQSSGSARKTALSLNIAKLVTNPDGTLNAQRLGEAIAQLGTAPTPQTEHTRLMVKMLTALRDDATFAAKLEGIGVPTSHSNPANGIIRATLGLSPNETVTPAHSRQAALSALLSDLRQSSVGSCFGTATAILVHDLQPVKFLTELKALIENGSFTKTLNNVAENVPISQRTSTRELLQTIKFDKQGNVIESGGKEVKPPAPLHEAPGMRAALAALGIPPDRMAAEIANAAKSLGKSANITPQALLQQIACGQVGLTQKHLDAVKNIRKLEGQIRELSTVASQQGPEGNVARAQMQARQKELNSALKSIDYTFKTEAMNDLAERMEQATDAFQSQMDNRLLRAWEYTVSSVLEKGAGDQVKQNAYDAITSTMSTGSTRQHMGLDTFAKDLMFSSREVVVRSVTSSSYRPVFSVRANLGMPPLAPGTPSDEALQAHSPNPEEHTATRETRFMNKFHKDLFAKFNEKLNARLGVQYDAAALGSGKIAADGSSDRGGFVLCDTRGISDSLEWQRIDTPEAFKELVSSIMRDVGREVANTASIGQSAEFAKWLTEFTETVASHAQTESFTDFMKDRAEKQKPGVTANAKPWEPSSGGTTHVASKYFESDTPLTESGIPQHGETFLQSFIGKLKELGEPITSQLAKHGRDFAMPVRTGTHAFLARPGHPSLHGALDAPDVNQWITDTLTTPGQTLAAKQLSAAEQKSIVEDILKQLEIPDGHPSRDDILAGLRDGKTPKQLHTWIHEQLQNHNPGSLDKFDTAERKSAALEAMIVRTIQPAPPRVTVADMNWEDHGKRVELSVLFNPITGAPEPWCTLEDGTLYSANVKPKEEWLKWKLATTPSEFGYS